MCPPLRYPDSNGCTQTVCGLSVVPGDWESLKRYNLTELYKLSTEIKEGTVKAENSSGI